MLLLIPPFRNNLCTDVFWLKEGTVSVYCTSCNSCMPCDCRVNTGIQNQEKVLLTIKSCTSPCCSSSFPGFLGPWLWRLFAKVMREGGLLSGNSYICLNAARDFFMAQEMGLWNPKQTSHHNLSGSHPDAARIVLFFALTAPSWLSYMRGKFCLTAMEVFSWLVFLFEDFFLLAWK